MISFNKNLKKKLDLGNIFLVLFDLLSLRFKRKIIYSRLQDKKTYFNIGGYVKRTNENIKF